MAHNLRARLQRIRDTAPVQDAPAAPHIAGSAAETDAAAAADAGTAILPGWTAAGFQTVKRSVVRDLPHTFPEALPRSLAILVPDLLPFFPNLPQPEDLLFFDLETTGLGGAGTLAFLAAFGRFVRSKGKYRLHVDQYLLLDYPGEGDFLEAVIAALVRPVSADTASSDVPSVIVTYNGKTFDAQIVKTRCLMNGIAPPVFAHADLLHPSRRLWKRLLPSCSQGAIETSVLGLDRTGDMSGALAPDMWFAFLRTGDAGGLLEICDHNIRDIFGLANLLGALIHVASDPVGAAETIRYDTENLALHWRIMMRRHGDLFGVAETAPGELLLADAASSGALRASYLIALDLMRQGTHEESRRRLLAMLNTEWKDGINNHDRIRSAIYRTLAIDAERRLRDWRAALVYVDAGLAIQDIPEGLKDEMRRRRERLLTKLNG